MNTHKSGARAPDQFFRCQLTGKGLKPRSQIGSLVLRRGMILECRKLRKRERIIKGKHYFFQLKNGKATFRRVVSVGPKRIGLRSLTPTPVYSAIARNRIGSMAKITGIITPIVFRPAHKKAAHRMRLSRSTPPSNGTRRAIEPMAA